ncbi:group II truncated hemoglobin [Breoghania sp.]|uniref:group II truncated hemoglobin n=1 Tax=Breoghania sp. TaxID=2065378 RepID=UPI002617F062|nr:group II truncated hemoglobin [Breoghania sp.]MDJ0931309.1 group II truncated hemoglobin [Breoghania sp.]
MTDTQEQTIFDGIGGTKIIERLVDSFYDRMGTLPEAQGIRALHADDLGPTRDILKRYLSEWTGGPKLYSPEKDYPRLRQRHLRIPIGKDERDAWLLCMRGAMEEAVPDNAVRAQLYDNMAKLADWMRNLPGSPHDDRHPHP